MNRTGFAVYRSPQITWVYDIVFMKVTVES